MTDVWYYEYIIKIWDSIDNQEDIRSGVVPADSITTAVKELSGYYGDEIMEIQMLKEIAEGIVFDFQEANQETEFDFIINHKEH